MEYIIYPLLALTPQFLQVAELKYKCLLISEDTTVEDVIRSVENSLFEEKIVHIFDNPRP